MTADDAAELRGQLAELRAEMNARFDRIELLLAELTRGLRAAGYLPAGPCEPGGAMPGTTGQDRGAAATTEVRTSS